MFAKLPNSAKETQDSFFHVILLAFLATGWREGEYFLSSCGASLHREASSKLLAWRGVQPSVNS